MAYTRRRASSRRTTSRRSTYSARRYSARKRAPVRRRATRSARGTSRRGSRAQTVRIVIEQPAQSPLARPSTLEALGIQPSVDRPKKARLGSGK